MTESIIDVYDCRIQTLTPIHIGSGKNYSSAEYISIKGENKSTKEIVNLIRRINFDKYYLNLSEDDRVRFIADVSSPNFKLSEFDSKINKDFRRYYCIDKSENIRNEIVEHIKTNDEIYIPGSSLKGAIKTALLYNLFDHSDIKDIGGLFKSGRYGEYIDKYKYPDFINSFFSSKKGGKAAQYNISKFLQVSDSTTYQRPDIHGVISIMGKRDAFNGFEYYRRNGNVVESFLETIPTKKVFKSRISINYDSNIYNNNQLQVNLNLKNKENLIEIDNIKKYIYDFSKDIIEHEIEFLEKYEYGNDLDGINSKLTNYYKKLEKINKPEVPIIKIGAGSGFLSMTIGIKIKKYDNALFERIRNALRGKSYSYEFPKSRKIIKESKMPLGWVKLDISEKEN